MNYILNTANNIGIYNLTVKIKIPRYFIIFSNSYFFHKYSSNYHEM